jgi:hypothetical protein
VHTLSRTFGGQVGVELGEGTVHTDPGGERPARDIRPGEVRVCRCAIGELVRRGSAAGERRDSAGGARRARDTTSSERLSH